MGKDILCEKPPVTGGGRFSNRLQTSKTGGYQNEYGDLMYNSQTVNWEMLKAYYVSGLPMDLIHAAATVIFILLAAEPMLEKLDRIKVKYGLVE